MCDVAEFGGAVDKAGASVLDSLELADGWISQAINKTITVEPAGFLWKRFCQKLRTKPVSRFGSRVKI